MISISRKYTDVFIILLVIFSINIFSVKFATEGVLKSIGYAYQLGAIVISLPFIFRKSEGFILPLQLISISIAFSIVMAYFSWGQGVVHSLSTTPYLIWFVFFYLLHIRYPMHMIEKIIISYGFIYMILFLFQFTHSDTVYFGFKDEFTIDRGIIRINFPGAGVFFLSYFISVNRSVEKSKFRWIYITFIIMGIAVTFLQVTRQNIALVMLVPLFHYLKRVTLPWKVATLAFFTGAMLLLLYSDNPVSKGLIETQKETVADGDQYIRVLAADYFLTDFSPNTLSRVLGNGFPNNTSDYGKYTIYLGDTYGYFLTDLGFIGFYIMFGILPVIGYLIIFIRGLFMRIPEDYQYLKYYLAFLLLTCLTSDYTYSMYFIFSNVCVLYCLQLIYEQNKIAREYNTQLP
jgi:hypothetical protein